MVEIAEHAGYKVATMRTDKLNDIIAGHAPPKSEAIRLLYEAEKKRIVLETAKR